MITQRTDCEFYPCHKKIEDCSFCYCPIYPCLDKRTGGKMLQTSRSRVWDCSDCTFIHNHKTIKKIGKYVKSLIEEEYGKK